MAEPRKNLNIVILGGSLGGISAAHHVLRQGLKELKADNDQFTYRVLLISPNTHIYWNISAPRVIVSKALISHDQSFIPIADGFKQYDRKLFKSIQATAIAIDTYHCVVTLDCIQDFDLDDDGVAPTLTNNKLDDAEKQAGVMEGTSRPVKRTVDYHALIIATGTTADSPLWSLHGRHENTLNAIDAMHNALPTAKKIAIAGGGPTGIETAGQIGYWYNLPKGLKTTNSSRSSVYKTFLRPHQQERGLHAKDITLFSSSDTLLPRLPPILGIRAMQQLKSLFVTVKTNVQVQETYTSGDKTILKLSNGQTYDCDIYIPCTGVKPNSNFLPPGSPLLNSSGYIRTVHDADNNSTLRVAIPDDLLPANVMQVDLTSTSSPTSPQHTISSTSTSTPLPRVYAVGDIADYSHQTVLDVYASMSTLEQNLLLDLKAYQLATSNSYGRNKEAIAELYSRSMAYSRDERDSQLCPIGAFRPGGVGVIQGHVLPSVLVYLLKGRGYKVDKAREVVEQDVSPYPAQSGAKRRG